MAFRFAKQMRFWKLKLAWFNPDYNQRPGNGLLNGEMKMILDKLLMFSEAQAVTATAASTDVIDRRLSTVPAVISALVIR